MGRCLLRVGIRARSLQMWHRTNSVPDPAIKENRFIGGVHTTLREAIYLENEEDYLLLDWMVSDDDGDGVNLE